MGHVDHGKTSLLDALRHTKVAEGEAGGITQHIGAFTVKVNDRQVTFLDTPGHAAFSALRSRGAQQRNDGVMEQTRESLRMIKEANAPMIVAINKIDKHNADVDKTKRMLLQEAIQLEEFGGDVQCVPISATKGTNLSQLVDAILVQTDLMNLRSEGKGPIEGVVIESKVDPGRGRLCTALVERGVLRKSSILVAGTAWAKVRGMFDHTGNPLTKATPSTPVEVIGWRDLPSRPKMAHQIIQLRQNMEMTEKQKQDEEVIKTKMDDYNKEYKAMLAEKRKQGRYKIRRQGPRQKEIVDDDSIRHSVIIKGDADGSVEAILDVLDTYDCHSPMQDGCYSLWYGSCVHLLLWATRVGDISESDVKLAEAFQACIYGFNVAIPEKLKPLCKELKVDYLLTNIIYRMVEGMVKDIEKRLPQKEKEEVVGEANVLAVFTITEGRKKIPVAGSRCVKGSLVKSSFFRLTRDLELLYDGPLHSLKHLKQEVETIRNGIECGLSFNDHTIIPKEGDTITCYHYVKVPQKCEWGPWVLISSSLG
ncbi:Translation initiation factor IF-2, mitochondrial [Orchesella cincta]|uniref:Translation initiation factor IF-2, mitochondrial n=1 Tax=Orchesella cincta TaxID=48709 RepID=A0A1D2MY84_ORCCI|nr:Translation initiation factor IF-2, mitochondrial [Orchesella cincta]